MQRLAAITFLFCLALVSCTKVDDYKSPEVIFEIDVTDIQEQSATVTISHNGSRYDRYCGFLIQASAIDVNSEIQKYIIENGYDTYHEAMTQKKKVITLSSLCLDTPYTYIVFGIDRDMKVVGTPAFYSFSTLKPTIEFIENPFWSLTEMGEDFYEKAYYTKVLFKDNSQHDERCLVWILNESEYKDATDISTLITKTLRIYSAKNSDMTGIELWADNDWIIHQSTAFYFKREPGKYMVLAIGIQANGSLTGHYASSGIFTIEEYTENPNYSKYYGNWTMTDADGNKHNVSISKKTTNRTLLLNGFCGSELPITINVDETDGKLSIYKQLLSENVMFKKGDEHLTANANLKGWYLKKSGKAIISSSLLSTGNMDSDGRIKLTNYFQNTSDIDDVQYGIVITVEGENNTFFGKLDGSILRFPIVLSSR